MSMITQQTSKIEPYWYHTIPDVAQGVWTLTNMRKYLGYVDFKDKSVLEVGAASGRVTLALEEFGAKHVTPTDLVPGYRPDSLFYSEPDYYKFFERLNESFKVTKREKGLKSTLIPWSVYHQQLKSFGVYNITVVANVLQHLRDPIKALRNITELTKDTLIIVENLRNWPLYFFTDLMSSLTQLGFYILSYGKTAPCFTPFFPEYGIGEQCVYGYYTPTLMSRLLDLFCFKVERTVYHYQLYRNRRSLQVTYVARRFDGKGLQLA